MSIKINHVAIVVEDMDRSMAFWRDAIGLNVGKQEHVAAEEVDVMFMDVANAHIELVSPTTTDSGIARYLEKKGEGIHHLCLEVDNLNEVLERLIVQGIEVINEQPRIRETFRYAFVHPRSTGGVLVELYERI